MRVRGGRWKSEERRWESEERRWENEVQRRVKGKGERVRRRV